MAVPDRCWGGVYSSYGGLFYCLHIMAPHRDIGISPSPVSLSFRSLSLSRSLSSASLSSLFSLLPTSCCLPSHHASYIQYLLVLLGRAAFYSGLVVWEALDGAQANYVYAVQGLTITLAFFYLIVAVFYVLRLFDSTYSLLSFLIYIFYFVIFTLAILVSYFFIHFFSLDREPDGHSDGYDVVSTEEP